MRHHNFDHRRIRLPITLSMALTTVSLLACRSEATHQPEPARITNQSTNAPAAAAAEPSNAMPASDSLTDEQIAAAVRSELMLDHTIPPNSIKVEVTTGVVELTGTLDNLLAKRRAALLAETIKGVLAVSDRVQVEPDPNLSDVQLRKDVRQALAWDPATDAYELDVSVLNATARLSGTVDSWAEKELSETVAASVRGVVDVRNDIDVQYKARRPDYEISREIEQRWKWDALIGHNALNVWVNGGQVQIGGQVGSAAERRRAVRDAWVNGVRDVDASGVDIVWFERNPVQREEEIPVRTDNEIRTAILLAATYDPRVSSFEIDPQVSNGVVTLNGQVDHVKAKRAAEQLARYTVGVSHVVNDIDVRRDVSPDQRIAAAIRGRLLTNPFTDALQIAVNVDNGRVTLTGTVDTFAEKAEAEDVSAQVRGVVAVIDKLQVNDTTAGFYHQPYVYPYHPYVHPWHTFAATGLRTDEHELEQQIERELFWSPFVDEDQVQVEAQGTRVILTGIVDSWRERDAATENAFEGGASWVENRLHVDAS